MPAQLILSNIKMDSSNFQGVSVIKKEPDSDGDENINETTRDGSGGMRAQLSLSGFEMDMLHLQGECVVKKEPDSDGDENINEPMRDRSRGVQVCGNENSYGNSGESILGLSSDISVPNENNIYEDLPSDSVPPAVLSSQLRSRDLMGSSVKNEPCNINVNLSSVSVEPVISAVEGQDSLFYSDFHIKTEDKTPFSVGSDLKRENDELSENVPWSIGVPSVSDMPMKVVCTQKNDSSGAASVCISKSTYTSRELPAAFVKTRRLRHNEPALGLMPGAPAKANPHDTPTRTSHTAAVCEIDTPGPSGRDGSNGSNSTDMLYSCQICNKTFTHNRHLNFHMRIHAEDRTSRNDKGNNAVIQSEPKLFKCTECEYKSVHRGALNEHKKIHSSWKPYKCQECDYASAFRSRLKVHQRTHTGERPYKCPECEYTSAYANLVKIHQLTHSGVKPFKCTECNYAAAESRVLKIHQRTHSGLKPYKCADCDYEAGQKSQLKTHVLIHSGAKHNKCTECNYTAARIDVLKRHQRTHRGLKPYKCAECDYTAAQKYQVKTHELIHRGEKPYKCAECDFSTIRKSSLTAHQRIHSRMKPNKC